MSVTYKLADAKAHFSELFRKAMLGESIVVTKDNRPVVKIIAIKPSKRLRDGKGYLDGARFRHTAGGFREYI